MKKSPWKKETLSNVSSNEVVSHIQKRISEGWELRSCEYFPGNMGGPNPGAVPHGFHLAFVRKK